MVLCVIFGCSNRSERDKHVSYYKIPSVITHTNDDRDRELSTKRRDGFLAAISREDLTVEMLESDSKTDYRVCSRHFQSGKPAKLYDVTSPDWLPSINLGHSKQQQSNQQLAGNNARYERTKRRAAEQRAREKNDRICSQQMEAICSSEIDLVVSGLMQEIVQQTIDEVTTIESSIVNVMDHFISDFVNEELRRVSQEAFELEILHRAEGKCECSEEIKALKYELKSCHATIDELSTKLKEHLPSFCEESVTDDEFVLYYTGLPNVQVLKAIFKYVLKTMPFEGINKLTPFQEFMCTLQKLRSNTPLQGLAYQFGVSKATVSRIISRWLVQMDLRLQDLIIWPDRDNLQKTMPICFQESFGKKVAVIIDCFEIFIDRPSNLKARASTWSNYKHRNTAKVLIGITPQGTVAFMSDAWGGRASDKYITENCGILKKLLPGDIILADRGFDIAESVGLMQAKLHIPAFTKGKSQLSPLEVEETRSIANVRIHVERVIGLVRQKFTILQSTLPIQFVATREEDDCPSIDRMIRICCALTNCCDSVVPFD